MSFQSVLDIASKEIEACILSCSKVSGAIVSGFTGYIGFILGHDRGGITFCVSESELLITASIVTNGYGSPLLCKTSDIAVYDTKRTMMFSSKATVYKKTMNKFENLVSNRLNKENPNVMYNVIKSDYANAFVGDATVAEKIASAVKYIESVLLLSKYALDSIHSHNSNVTIITLDNIKNATSIAIECGDNTNAVGYSTLLCLSLSEVPDITKRFIDSIFMSPLELLNLCRILKTPELKLIKDNYCMQTVLVSSYKILKIGWDRDIFDRTLKPPTYIDLSTDTILDKSDSLVKSVEVKLSMLGGNSSD